MRLKRGDHIYIECSGYTHHGINCGDGTVIHHPGGLDQKTQALISRTSMSDFADGKLVRVRKYGKCDPPDIVIERAESQLGAAEYNLFNNNCEHFTTRCKTGEHKSQQVALAAAVAGRVVKGATVLTTAGVAVAFVAAPITTTAAVGFGAYRL